MKKRGQHEPSLIETIAQQCISDGTKTKTVICYRLHKIDGSLCWIWPADSAKPHFLRFSPRKSWSSKVFHWCIQMLFYLRLQPLVFRSKVSMIIPTHWEEWALCIDDPGPHSMAIFWMRQGMENRYIKLPLGLEAAQILKHEAKALDQLAKTKVFHIQTPQFIGEQKNAFVQTDIRTPILHEVDEISKIPIVPWMELLSLHANKKQLKQIPFWREIKHQLESNAWDSIEAIPQGLITKLRWLIEAMEDSRIITTSMAYGDFTSSNLFLQNNQLVLMDWRNSLEDAPVLFDVFHAIYHEELHSGTRRYAELRKSIASFFKLPYWSNWLDRNGIDIWYYERLYLLLKVNSQLQMIAKNKPSETNAIAMMDIYSQAISHHLIRDEATAIRNVVINDVFDYLADKPYAVMKLAEEGGNAMDWESDMDICISSGHAKALIRWLRSHAGVAGIRISRLSYAKQLAVELIDGSSIQMDLMHAFKRKQLEFLPADELLSTALRNAKGIKVPRPDYAMAYTALYYVLNHAPMAECDVQNSRLALPSDHGDFHQKLTTLFGPYQGDSAKMLSELRKRHQWLLQCIRSFPANRGWKGRVNAWRYRLDQWLDMRKSKGCVITFSGVHGAGKSTVISLVRDRIEKEFRRKVVVLRHRPSVLPLVRKIARSQQLSSASVKWVNKVCFGYCYLDYVIGQFYIHARYVASGYVVLYDRYYLDFVNDSERNNIPFSPSTTSALYRLLIKPQYNFLLYAQPDTILKRNQKLDHDAIVYRTSNYLKYFEILGGANTPSSYIPIYNDELASTVDSICARLSA